MAGQQIMTQQDIDNAIAKHEAEFTRYGWIAVGLLVLHDLIIIVAVKFII
jgi:predicted Kef-type K+ transport protein